MNDDAAPYNVKLAAARDLLDRADLSGRAKLEIEVPLFEQALSRVRVRRGPRDGGASTDSKPMAGEPPKVIEGRVIKDEPDPSDYTAEAKRRPAITRPTPTVEHVNSDDTPPAHIAARTPSYRSAGRRRGTGSEMRNG